MEEWSMVKTSHRLSEQQVSYVFTPEDEEVRIRTELAAKTCAPLLLLGPTGSGKSRLASHIHSRHPSPRRKGPFRTVSCANLTSTLIDSELFGHRRGAFTGAAADHIGLVESANGGTLFLDEIGELPQELYSKLLLLLANSEIKRVGDTEQRKVDVRIIAATDQTLEGLGDRMPLPLLERFRQWPPIELRSLRFDWAKKWILFRQFVEFEAERQGLTRPTNIGFLSWYFVVGYPWPGNIRELESYAHYALHFECLQNGRFNIDKGFGFFDKRELVSKRKSASKPEDYSVATLLRQGHLKPFGERPNLDGEPNPLIQGMGNPVALDFVRSVWARQHDSRDNLWKRMSQGTPVANNWWRYPGPQWNDPWLHQSENCHCAGLLWQGDMAHIELLRKWNAEVQVPAQLPWSTEIDEQVSFKSPFESQLGEKIVEGLLAGTIHFRSLTDYIRERLYSIEPALGRGKLEGMGIPRNRGDR